MEEFVSTKLSSRHSTLEFNGFVVLKMILIVLCTFSFDSGDFGQCGVRLRIRLTFCLWTPSN